MAEAERLVRQDSRDNDAGVYIRLAEQYSVNNDAAPHRVDVAYGFTVIPGLIPTVIATPYAQVQTAKAENSSYRTGEALYAHIFPSDDWRRLPPGVRALYQAWAHG